MQNDSIMQRWRAGLCCVVICVVTIAYGCGKPADETTTTTNSFPTFPGCEPSNIRVECNSALNQVGNGWFIVGTSDDPGCVSSNSGGDLDSRRTMYCYDSQPKGCRPTVCAQGNPLLNDWPVIGQTQSIYCPAGEANAFELKRQSSPPAIPVCSGQTINPSTSLCSALTTRDVCASEPVQDGWLLTGYITKQGCSNQQGRREVCITTQPLGCQLTVCASAFTPNTAAGWSIVKYEPAGNCTQGEDTAVLLERHNSPKAGAVCQ
jgi:hypothetical protein